MKHLILFAIIAFGAISYFQRDQSIDPNMTLFQLKEGLPTQKVLSAAARIAFENAIVQVCITNGQDIRNGFGTTQECTANYQQLARSKCFAQLPDFETKVYRRKAPLEADFEVFFRCAMQEIDLLKD